MKIQDQDTFYKKNCIFFIVILGSLNLTASAQTVNFPDANLAAAVRSELGLAADAAIPQTSQGAVTEADVASNGTNPGDTVGNYAWTLSEISPTGTNNINEVINQIGWSRDPHMPQYSAYALITSESDRVQSGVAMRVGNKEIVSNDLMMGGYSA